MQRTIWIFFFLVGIYILAGFAIATDTWVSQSVSLGSKSMCRGTLAGDIPLSRAPLCAAVWVQEAKHWVYYASEVLVNGNQALYLHEVTRTVDVALFAIGVLAAALALNWVWANAMTYITLAATTGCYLVLYALSHMQRRQPQYAPGPSLPPISSEAATNLRLARVASHPAHSSAERSFLASRPGGARM